MRTSLHFRAQYTELYAWVEIYYRILQEKSFFVARTHANWNDNDDGERTVRNLQDATRYPYIYIYDRTMPQRNLPLATLRFGAKQHLAARYLCARILLPFREHAAAS